MKKNIVSLLLVAILMTTICIPAFANTGNCCALKAHDNDAVIDEITPQYEPHCDYGGRLIITYTVEDSGKIEYGTCPHGMGSPYMDSRKVYNHITHHRCTSTICGYRYSFVSGKSYGEWECPWY